MGLAQPASLPTTAGEIDAVLRPACRGVGRVRRPRPSARNRARFPKASLAAAAGEAEPAGSRAGRADAVAGRVGLLFAFRHRRARRFWSDAATRRLRDLRAGISESGPGGLPESGDRFGCLL